MYQIISLYKNKKYNEFLRVTDYRFRITSIASKKVLKENIVILVILGDNIIEQINEKGICLIDDRLITFKENKKYLYNRVKDVKFIEFQNYMNTIINSLK